MPVKKTQPVKAEAIKEDDDLITVTVIRGIAAGKPGDIVDIKREYARKLQEVGAVRVVI